MAAHIFSRTPCCAAGDAGAGANSCVSEDCEDCEGCEDCEDRLLESVEVSPPSCTLAIFEGRSPLLTPMRTPLSSLIVNDSSRDTRSADGAVAAAAAPRWLGRSDMMLAPAHFGPAA